MRDNATQAIDALMWLRRRRKTLTAELNLGEIRGKNALERKRDRAILNLVEHMRVNCVVPWSESPIKPAVLAFSLWRLGFKSKRPKSKERETSTDRREMMQEGFAIIERSWSIIANDTKLIYSSHLLSLREYLGEVGAMFFDEALVPSLLLSSSSSVLASCCFRPSSSRA
jgi:hypothetical protein